MASYSPRLDGLERNLIINGAFDFWQRGTSVACNNNDDKYLADRFVIDVWAASVSATGTYSRSADVPTQAQSGFNSRYSLLYTNTSANSNSITVRYEVEGQDYQQIHAQKIRVQFWVKSSVAGTYSLGLQNGANQNRSYLTTYTIASANTWQKVAIDVQLDQTGTWNFNETAGLSILWGAGVPGFYGLSALNTWVSSRVTGYTGNTASWSTTSGATFQIAQVSLIPQDFTLAGASNVDVPFQRAGRTIGHELAMCQRYYEKLESQGLQMTLTSFQANQERNWYSWKVTKRATPVVVATSPNIFLSGVSTAASSPDFTNEDTNGTLIVFNNTLPVDQSRMITIATMTADAEL